MDIVLLDKNKIDIITAWNEVNEFNIKLDQHQTVHLREKVSVGMKNKIV